jgi:ABC-type antimicrobial peptide transport system permease subunit
MFRLASRSLLARRARALFTALTIALGVAMIFAMRIVGNTLDATARSAREGRLAGADLEVVSAAQGQLALDVRHRLEALPEVERAAPVYRALEGKTVKADDVGLVSTLEGTGLNILGVDPHNLLTAYTLSSGKFLTDSQSVLLPATWAVAHGYSLGQRIELTIGDTTQRYTIVGLLKSDNLSGAPTAWLTLDAVNTALHSNDVASAFLIRLKTGYAADAARENVQAVLGNQYFVNSAGGGGNLNSLYNIIGLALPVAGFGILLAGAFLVFNAFAITLAERRREIGQLRALGMTRGQTLAQTLLEAGLIGLLGSTLGVLLGWALGAGVVNIIQNLNGDKSVAATPIPWDAFPLAFGAGILVTVGVTLTLALQAARVSPLAALKDTAAPPSRPIYQLLITTALALLLFLATYGFYTSAIEFFRTAITPSYGPVFLPVFTFGVGAALLLPAWIQGALWVWRKLLAREITSQLAAANLARSPQRTALTAATLVVSFMLVTFLTGVALFMSSFLIGMNTSILGGRPALIRAMPPGTSLAESSALPSQPPVPPDLQADLGALSDDADLLYFANVSLPGIGVESGAGDQYAFAMDARMVRHSVMFPLEEGTWEGAHHGFLNNEPAIWLPGLTAKKFNKHVGDVIEINTLQGHVPFHIVAVGGGFPIISPDSAAQYFSSHPFAVFFDLKPDTDPQAFDARLDSLLNKYPAAISRLDTKNLQSVVDDLIGPLQAMFSGLASLSGLVAALGIVVTLFATVLERQREIGTLRALGLKRHQVRNIVVTEAGFIGFAGATLGALGGLGMAALFAQTMNGGVQAMMGVSMVSDPPLPWALALAAIFIGPAVAMLAALFPADRAANINPAEAMRVEGASGFAPQAAKRPLDLPEARLPRFLPLFLASRALAQDRARAMLSIIAIALGATTTVAGDLLAQSIINVVTRTDDLRAIGEGLWSQLDPTFKGIGAGIMLAAGFLIFNTFAMSLTQRRQQIGALRALGMTRGQVLRMALTEALLMGGAGTLIGLIVGPFFGQAVIAFMRSLNNNLRNVFAPSEPAPLSFILAAVMGIGATLLAALLPAQQAMKLSPLAALKTPEISGISRPSHWLGGIGLAYCSLFTVCLLLAPPANHLPPPTNQAAAVLLAILWVTGGAVSLPLLIDITANVLRWLIQTSEVRAPDAGIFKSMIAHFRSLATIARLMTDNFRRNRGRVLLTVVTLAISLTMIGALTGFIQFYLFEFFGPKLEALKQEGAWVASMMDMEKGMAGYANVDSIRAPLEVRDAIRATAGDRANVLDFSFVIVPELSFMGDAYFSFVLNPQMSRDAGDLFITFKQGDWDTAFPILERGCGVFITPAVAARNNVANVGETFTVTSKYGQVECTVAGIGATFVGASIISAVAQDQFDRGDPFSLLIQARPDVDRAQLEADLFQTAEKHGMYITRMSRFTDLMLSVFENLPLFFNAFLLMAVVAAALGVVNTTLISVNERRREFGQLRALGATRAHIQGMVMGEAALMGLLGGGVGVIASVGLTVIFATVHGGSSVGIVGYEPWAAALRTLPKVLPTSVLGMVASPLICALAAYFPARSVLRGSAIEILNPTPRRAAPPSWLNRGSLQTRFVLGTALLLILVLGGLIQAVTMRLTTYFEQQSTDTLRPMLAWQTAFLESALPPAADNLRLSDVQALTQFNAQGLLDLQSLFTEKRNGMTMAFALADRDHLALISTQTSEIGDTLTPAPDKLTTLTRRTATGDLEIAGIAPIKNKDGEIIGSLRLSVVTPEFRLLAERLRNTLWLGGGLIVALATLLAWLLSLPLTRATHKLAAHASDVSRGNYLPFTNNPLPITVSIRARFTILMILSTLTLVGGLSLIVIPIQKEQIENTLQNSMLSAAEWMGNGFSRSFDQLPSDMPLDLTTALHMAQNLDPARMRELAADSRAADLIAYLAITNDKGEILLSDDTDQIGETAPFATEAQVFNDEWNGAPVWVVVAPLRNSQTNEVLGNLRLGLKTDSLEQFLSESRTIFTFTGIIAILIGVLLAQGLGSAVAAPIESLAAQTRRVAQGDLQTQFRAAGNDEIAQLGAAFNEMVRGLQEREKLRDLFGKFVSPEVREAIESGRVTLKGERKTITCLYVDMRGSTTFAEHHTPEEVMAALNEYFEVIILAVEAHGGIVNRFVGDEAVCVFGAPTELPDHADCTLNAALAIRQGLAYLNARRAAANLPTLKFGMGLNTGEVVAGATGSEERQEYTVIGDAMNVGARIQALNKVFPEYDILLSEFTVAGLKNDYALTDLGEVEIRGKRRAVRVWGVIAEKASG